MADVVAPTTNPVDASVAVDAAPEVANQNVRVRVTCDGKEFVLDGPILRQASTLMNLWKDLGMEAQQENGGASVEIPIPENAGVSAETFAKVIQWMQQHRDDPKYVHEYHDMAEKRRELPPWDKEFLSNVDHGTLFDLTIAANYLDIERMVEFCCRAIACLITGKKAEEIRAMFNIANEWTPEEEADNKKQNSWIDDD